MKKELLQKDQEQSDQNKHSNNIFNVLYNFILRIFGFGRKDTELKIEEQTVKPWYKKLFNNKKEANPSILPTNPVESLAIAEVKEQNDSSTKLSPQSIESTNSATSTAIVPTVDHTACYNIININSLSLPANGDPIIISTKNNNHKKELAKNIIKIPHINNTGPLQFSELLQNKLPEDKKEYLASELKKSHKDLFNGLETGHANYHTIEKFNDLVNSFIIKNEIISETRDIERLGSTLENLDCYTAVSNYLTYPSTKTFKELYIKKDEDLQLQDPETGYKIKLLGNIPPEDLARCEREDLKNNGHFLGVHFVEHLAAAILLNVPVMIIGQEEFQRKLTLPREINVGFKDMFTPNKTGESTSDWRIINPTENATTVATIVALPSHYISITFHKQNDTWTAYVVDSMADNYTKVVTPIIAKFKAEMGCSHIDVVYNSYDHQKAFECGIHSIENIQVIAEHFKNSESALTQEQLSEIMKNNDEIREGEAKSKNTTRREIMFMKALKQNPSLETSFNIVPGRLLKAEQALEISSTESNTSSNDSDNEWHYTPFK